MAGRTEFLDRIRREVARTSGLFPASSAARPSRAADEAEALGRQMSERWPEALARFRMEFERVAGVFHSVRALSDVPAAVLAIAAEKSASRVVAWDPAVLGLDLAPALTAAGLSLGVAALGETDEAARSRHRDQAAAAQIGVTGVDVALGETGSLIVISGAGRPRSTSLLPDTHVAVFDRRRLVESLEQVGILFEAWHADPARSMTGAMINVITGPSRTADIELTLTRGVHGPKEVHAIFVESP
jgi:L-lactate dehydrogenase complex protein LldG